MNTDTTYLDKQRAQGDHEADVLVASLFSSNQQAVVYRMLRLPENEIKLDGESPLKIFLLSTKPTPAWFNSERINRGQLVFKKYAQEMMTLLGAMSLPYCYAASPGNKALYLSEKMRQSTGKRLVETAAFVINVLTPKSLEEDNVGHIHINKTRLIHAVARYYINRSGWENQWGVPINQEDMAGTNLAFSYIILLGMQQSGFGLSVKEKEDFLFAWRYIGYQLNIDENLLPSSFREATVLTQIIKERNFKKTDEGIALTNELLSYFKTVIPPQQASFIEAQIRFYLGKEVAGYIGLQPDSFKDKVTSLVNSARSLKNMLAAPSDSFDKMLAEHVLLRKKFIG